MDPLAIVCFVIGIVIIAFRGPLIFAPQRTLRFYESVIATDARARLLGAILAAMGVAILVSGSGTAVFPFRVLGGFGWLLTVAGALVLLFPPTYRRIGYSVLEFTKRSVGPIVLRAIGVIAVAIGVAFIYLGFGILS